MVLFYCSSNCVHTVGGFGVYIKHFNREIKGRAINHSVAMVLPWCYYQLSNYLSDCVCARCGLGGYSDVQSNKSKVETGCLLCCCYGGVLDYQSIHLMVCVLGVQECGVDYS